MLTPVEGIEMLQLHHLKCKLSDRIRIRCRGSCLMINQVCNPVLRLSIAPQFTIQYIAVV